MSEEDQQRIQASLREWRKENPKQIFDKSEHFIHGFMIGYAQALQDLAKKEHDLRAPKASIRSSGEGV